MIPLVPSDLLEIPAISYFKYRNRGKVLDIKLTSKIMSEYLAFYRKDPRDFFQPRFQSKLQEFSWTQPVNRGSFFYSTGILKTPYNPIFPILNEEKYQSVRMINVHRYSTEINDGENKQKTATLFIHGYAESTFLWQELSYFRLFKSIFNSDVYAFELPHHFNRQPSDSPFSGAYFLNGNPVRMLESIRQSLQEILLLSEFLKLKYKRIIIVGISLGGHILALTSQFLQGVDLVIGLASPFLFSLNPIITPVSVNIVSQMKEDGHENWYKILYACNLKYFSPFTTNNQTVIIGGLYDRIVPIARVKQLSIMLQKPLLTYPGGHISLIIWLRSLLKQIEKKFKEN